MAYASIPNIRAAVSIRQIDGSSDPSIQEVAQMIDDIAGDIDVALSARGYSIPVDGSASAAYVFLRQLNTYGAAMRVEAASAKGDESPHLKFLERQYDKRWQMLIDQDLPLPGLTTDENTTSPRAGGVATSMFSVNDER